MEGIYLIAFVFMIAGWLVSMQLNNRFKEYSVLETDSGLSGRHVAEKMLRDHNIYDVSVVSVEGELTDHYNPSKMTIDLSRDVYYGRNIASTAVAAHECGHAVQHAKAYSFLKLRSALVPVVSFSSNIVQWILLAGILLVNSFPALLLSGIVLFAVITLFSLITLPVEFDASRRALVWLSKNTGLISLAQQEKAKDALWWAAMTYVVAALSSLATLFYYIMLFMGRRKNE